MTRIDFPALLCWLLAAFFVVGGCANLFATEEIRADYLRWGYPGWFNYVTGTLELTTALLLALPRTRLAGAALGCCIMAAAGLSVVLAGETAHGLAPLVVFCATLAAGLLTLRRRRAATA